MCTAKTKLKHAELRRAVTASFRLIIAVAFLSFIAPATASAQMGSSAIYSDAWVYTSNNSGVFGTPTIRIMSCGVTQDNNNMYGHTYWVVTNLRSPSGRAASATSYKTTAYSAYARAETSLTWDWNNPDKGNWQVQTQHMMCCPYMASYNGGCYPTPSLSL